MYIVTIAKVKARNHLLDSQHKSTKTIYNLTNLFTNYKIKNKTNQLSIDTKRKSNYRSNLSIQKNLGITHIYKIAKLTMCKAQS
jgi:hypothetical protein